MSAGNTTRVGLGIASGAGLMALLADPGKTFQSIEWAWLFLLRVIETGPVTLWVVPLSVLAGWLATLRVSMLPLGSMSPVGAALVAQFAGTAAAFGVVWFMWREPMGIIVGAIIALSTPYSWALFLIILEAWPSPWATRWAAELRGEGRQLRLFGDGP